MALSLSEGFVSLEMAAIRCTTSMIVKEIFHPSLPLRSGRMFQMVLPNFSRYCCTVKRGINYSRIICAAADSEDGGKKMSARFSQVHQLLQEAEERSLSFGNEATPKITLGIQSLSLLYMLECEKPQFCFYFCCWCFLFNGKCIIFLVGICSICYHSVIENDYWSSYHFLYFSHLL